MRGKLSHFHLRGRREMVGTSPVVLWRPQGPWAIPHQPSWRFNVKLLCIMSSMVMGDYLGFPCGAGDLQASLGETWEGIRDRD